MSFVPLLCSHRSWLPWLLGAGIASGAAPAAAAPDLLPDYASLIADAGECADDYAEMAAPQAGTRLPDVETAAAPREAAPVLLAALEKSAKSAPPAARAAHAPASATAPAAPEAAPSAILKWEIRSSDHTLNVAMARWAAIAGWQLLWEVPVDYAVEADTSIPGTFEYAVEAVTHSMETAEIPLKAIFYKGNSVIRIVAKGAE